MRQKGGEETKTKPNQNKTKQRKTARPINAAEDGGGEEEAEEVMTKT